MNALGLSTDLRTYELTKYKDGSLGCKVTFGQSSRQGKVFEFKNDVNLKLIQDDFKKVVDDFHKKVKELVTKSQVEVFD